MHSPRKLLRRAVSSGDGASFTDFWGIPATLGPGTVELASPDCWARWTLTHYTDDGKDHVTAAYTGPASRAALLVPEGGGHLACQVVNTLLNNTDASLRADGTPKSSWASTVETNQVAASASTMAAEARFYVGVSPDQLVACQPAVVWLGTGDVTAAHGALEVPPGDAQSPDLATTVEAIVGCVPGYCNRIGIWCTGDTQVKIYGADGTLVGTSTASAYHELAVSPWDWIALKQSTGSDVKWRAHLWRE